ncbi:MAG: hypothetical protein COA94_03975 [Rickettsiales bacterium]|nr:MAG: hypothetical protein COA94_03975 [Rickettsiales bacterium]
MLKSIYNFLLRALSALYLALLCLLPFQWHKIGSYSEIFPAFDLIIVFYLNTYKNLQHWHLFIIGLIVDRFYFLPVGSSSLLFILANMGLKVIARWLLLQNYLTNFAIFCVYSIFIMLSRELIVTIKSTYYIEGFALYFYILTTIFAYPIICMLINKPIKILTTHAE